MSGRRHVEDDRVPHRLAVLALGGVKPRLAEDGVLVEAGNGTQERLGEPVLEDHFVHGLELEDHHAVLSQRGRRVGVDGRQIRREFGNRGADRRLAEIIAEAIIGIGLEQQGFLAATRALVSDGGGHGTAANAAFAAH